MARSLMIPSMAVALVLSHGVAARSGDLKIPVPAVDVQQISVDYQCEAMEPIKVVYINAGANSLAVVPVDGDHLIFAAVISGSGTRYAAGPYIWWSHQGDATLGDIRKGEDAAPLKCSKVG